MSEELLPCPFCGGPAERVDIDEGENAGGSCIACTSCLACSNIDFGFKENFVSNWSRRVAQPLVPADVEDEMVAARLIRAVAELPDRTSPEGQPEMMLVSEGELFDLLVPVIATQRHRGWKACQEAAARDCEELAQLAGEGAADEELPDVARDRFRAHQTAYSQARVAIRSLTPTGGRVMTDVPQDVREKVESALNKALLALQSASRQLTEQHKIALNGNQWGDTAITAVEAAIAALRGAGWRTVPEGFVVVPLTPTAGMIGEAWPRVTRRLCEHGHDDAVKDLYVAMLTAAPEPPA